MAYDFKRNYTSTFSNGITTNTVNSNFRTLHGFFGAKFQTGSGAFRVFVDGKVGFDNFTVNNQSAQTGFTNTVGLNQWCDLLRRLSGGRNRSFCWPDWSAG